MTKTMTDSVQLGHLREDMYDTLVGNALRAADGCSLFALTIHPDGSVWAEPSDDYAEEDLVGIFEPVPARRADIREALKFDAVARCWRSAPRQSRNNERRDTQGRFAS